MIINNERKLYLKKGQLVLIGDPLFNPKRLGKIIELRQNDFYIVNMVNFDYSNYKIKGHNIHISLIEPLHDPE